MSPRRSPLGCRCDLGARGPGWVGRVGFEGFDRLWDAARMAYVAPERPSDDGCPFCAMEHQADDESLVVATGSVASPCSYLHPYNPGHLMVLRCGTSPTRGPRRRGGARAHRDDAAGDPGAARGQRSARPSTSVSTSAASRADRSQQHLHQHVVPRWSGDANFITVVGPPRPCRSCSPTPALLREAWSTSRE